ncbi:MAG: PEP-CTERM sorting domain-containing protein [Planctomycetes bacterium]|nr:PEP-CTERM sorting domain-containing protein [Planctomycetota bacterium]
MHDVLVPVDVLTGIFFDISGSALSLSRVSAVVAGGSTVAFGTTDPGNVVGGEWCYVGGLSGAPGSAAYGIGSAGFGLFGPGNLFPGNNLQGPTGPNGLEYGITSMGDNLATGNTPVTGTQALIKHSVVFTLGGVGSNFDLSRIGNVSFQYGTALNEPNIRVPAPSTAALMGLGAAASLRRRRR